MFDHGVVGAEGVSRGVEAGDPVIDEVVLSDDDVAWGLDGPPPDAPDPWDDEVSPGLDGRRGVRLVGAVERRGSGGRQRAHPDAGPSDGGAPALRRPGSLAEAAELARPTVLAEERTLPVLPALVTLLPDGALQRGATVAVDGGPGATSLAMALLAGPSQAGSWMAVVGLDGLGLAAAEGLGVDLEHVVLVAEPPPRTWGAVVAAMVGAVDVVVVAPRGRVRAGDARRLAARQRERGTVVVAVGGDAVGGGAAGVGLDVDVRLAVVGRRWSGLEQGHGHLRACRLEVEAGGRRRAAQPRRTALWLPDVEGRVAVAEPGLDGTGAVRHPGAGLRRVAG